MPIMLKIFVGVCFALIVLAMVLRSLPDDPEELAKAFDDDMDGSAKAMQKATANEDSHGTSKQN